MIDFSQGYDLALASLNEIPNLNTLQLISINCNWKQE